METKHLSTETITIPRKCLPSDAVWAALDCGTSLLKLIFVDKEENCAIGAAPDSNVTLHGQLYKRTDMAAALEVLKARVYIPPGRPILKTTGTGYGVCKELIESTLSVKLVFMDEFQCACFAAQALLQHKSDEELFHPFPTDTRKYVFTTNLKAEAESLGPKMIANNHDGRSCPMNLLIIGSSMIFMHVDADGKMTVKALPLLGGMPFLGMASLMLGTADYDEVMSLAARGNIETCYWLMKDCVPKGDEYGEYDYDTPLYPFGRLAREPNCTASKEDIAVSLVSFFAQIAYSVSGYVSEMTGISRFYVSGNWIRSEIARRYILQQLSIEHPSVLTFDFFKTGLLSVIGSLLMNTDQK